MVIRTRRNWRKISSPFVYHGPGANGLVEIKSSCVPRLSSRWEEFVRVGDLLAALASAGGM